MKSAAKKGTDFIQQQADHSAKMEVAKPKRQGYTSGDQGYASTA